MYQTQTFGKVNTLRKSSADKAGISCVKDLGNGSIIFGKRFDD